MQPESSEMYRNLSGDQILHVGSCGFPANFGVATIPGFATSFLPLEMARITEMPQARALAASRNHKEAEKRRRERIKTHLDRLRVLLQCNSKIDKATLLAKAVQHVRDLKQQTSEIAGFELLPTENDEITVFFGEFSGDGRSVYKVSLCCEDRSDLLPDLIETLKSLRLNLLKAEIATLEGRVQNVLLVAGEEGSENSVGFLRDALKMLLDRPDNFKRRRFLDRGNA